jgi:hypothetical protein
LLGQKLVEDSLPRDIKIFLVSTTIQINIFVIDFPRLLEIIIMNLFRQTSEVDLLLSCFVCSIITAVSHPITASISLLCNVIIIIFIAFAYFFIDSGLSIPS